MELETRIMKLKDDFNNIITIRTNVKNIFDILLVRINKLKQTYTEFINANKNETFIFGLDSFNFQTKLLDIEYYDMRRLFLAINNRMYCEYFKLHKIIVEYIKQNIEDKKNSLTNIEVNNFPIYKDLEPFKEYEFDIILDIHENIMNLIGVIISTLNNKENELFIYKTKQNIGLSIDNFIATFAFNNVVMREKIQMFTRYIEFFHKMHTKYLKRFSNKIQLMYTNINNDIKFDDTIEISKHKKKELIHEFTSGHIDEDLLKDLKTSIGSETNSEDTMSDSQPSPLQEIDKVKPDKKTYKDIFKHGVKKVSNILNLFNKPKDNDTNTMLSNNELDSLFFDINKSCEDIINEDNIELQIQPSPEQEQPFEPEQPEQEFDQQPSIDPQIDYDQPPRIESEQHIEQPEPSMQIDQEQEQQLHIEQEQQLHSEQQLHIEQEQQLPPIESIEPKRKNKKRAKPTNI